MSFDVTADDGWRLVIERRPAAGVPRGTVLLLHAMMVDRRSMDRPPGRGMASVLSELGWEVLLADYRGHGDSGPTSLEGGSWDYADLVRRDTPVLLQAARDHQAGPHLSVWGHSLGGHVTLAALGEGLGPVPDSVVAWSSNIWLPGLEPRRRRRLAKTVSLAAMTGLTTLVGRFPSRRLGIGPADEARPYVRDFWRSWVRDRWGDDVDWLAALARVPCPVLSVVGKGDALLAHRDGAAAFAARVGPHGATVWLVGRPDHGLRRDPGHMDLVTDAASRGVWEAASAWVLDQAVATAT